MSLVVNRGFKRIYAIGQRDSKATQPASRLLILAHLCLCLVRAVQGERWSGDAITQMTATAKQLGMQVVGSLVIAPITTDWSNYNTSSAEVTQNIMDLEVDMVVVLNTFEG